MLASNKLLKLGLHPGNIVLDVGFRPVDALRAFAEAVGPSGRVHGVDINAKTATKASEALTESERAVIHPEQGSISALPYDNASIDVVLCRSVLHEVKDLDRAVHEIHRGLTPGDRLVILDFLRFSRLELLVYRSWVRLQGKRCLDVHPGFRRSDLSELLTRHGLSSTHYEIFDGNWSMGFIRSPGFLLIAGPAVSRRAGITIA